MGLIAMNLATENQQLQHSKVAKAGPLPLQWSSSSALETQLYQFQLSSVGRSFRNMFQILIPSDLEIEWFSMSKKEVLICRGFLGEGYGYDSHTYHKVRCARAWLVGWLETRLRVGVTNLVVSQLCSTEKKRAG